MRILQKCVIKPKESDNRRLLNYRELKCRKHIEKDSRFLNNFNKIMYKHIKMNSKDYLILSLVFIIGVMIGVILINNSDENSKLELNGYLNSFVNTIKNESFEVDKVKLTQDIVVNNLKIVLIIWIAGTTVIGIPLIYVVTVYKGISIGYTISAIMLTFGNAKGFLFAISSLFLQNIIVIPIILMLNVSSLKMYRTLIQKNRKKSIKQEFVRHTVLCIILILPIIIASIISSYISSTLMIQVIKGLIK